MNIEYIAMKIISIIMKDKLENYDLMVDHNFYPRYYTISYSVFLLSVNFIYTIYKSLSTYKH